MDLISLSRKGNQRIINFQFEYFSNWNSFEIPVREIRHSFLTAQGIITIIRKF